MDDAVFELGLPIRLRLRDAEGLAQASSWQDIGCGAAAARVLRRRTATRRVPSSGRRVTPRNGRAWKPAGTLKSKEE
jgi:hypothetical protein